MVANLVHNTAQYALNLGRKVSFVSFMESGTHQPASFEDLGEQKIYALVQKDEAFKMMCVYQNSWCKHVPKVYDIAMPKAHEEAVLVQNYFAKHANHIKQLVFFRRSFSHKQARFVKAFINRIVRSAKEQLDGKLKEKLEFYQTLSRPRADFVLMMTSDEKTNIHVIDFRSQKEIPKGSIKASDVDKTSWLRTKNIED